MRLRRLLWILGALAGVVLAAGVTYAASSLSTQQVGLSAEPPSAGADLAPTPTATATATPRPRATRTPRPKRTPTPRPRATSTPAPVITAVPTVDDHGGESGDDDSSGRGRGRGRGGDDD